MQILMIEIYAICPKIVTFVKKKKTTLYWTFSRLLIPQTAYLEDVLLGKLTEIEKSIFQWKIL